MTHQPHIHAKFGLTLGGGGARGAVHIGVLMALEELGYKPDLITGTSIGGLVGAFYAAGRTPEQIKAFFSKITLSQIFSLPGSSPSLSANSKFERALQDEIGGRITFDDLTIPLGVVTVDLMTRKEVILSEGDVVRAVMATTAFPILLPPIQMGDMHLIDGGVLNNVPFDVARAWGATFVMAIGLGQTIGYGENYEEPPQQNKGLVARALSVTQRRPLWQVVTAVTDIMTNNATRAREAISPPNLMIKPNVGTIGLLDFHRLEEGITIGYEAVQAVADQLEQQFE